MNKQLALLSVVAALAIGGGVWLSTRTQPDQQEPQLLFTDGLQTAKAASQIVLKTSQETLLSAELSDDKWLAKFDDWGVSYPLDKSKLAEFLSSLVKARMVEAKTSKQENYHHLGVESIDNMDSLATLVSISSADNAKNWQVLVGNKANNGQGNYVRLPQSAQSWKIDQSLDLPGNKFSWLLRPILSLKSADIDSVSRIDKKSWSLVKGEEQEFTLKELPKGRTLRYPTVVTSLVDSLTSLDFDALLPLDSERWQQAKPLASLSVKTTDDKVLLIKIANLDADYFLQFSSAQLQGYWLDWTYQVSSFTAQQLAKSLEDFLAELPKSDSGKTQPSEIDEGESPH